MVAVSCTRRRTYALQRFPSEQEDVVWSGLCRGVANEAQESHNSGSSRVARLTDAAQTCASVLSARGCKRRKVDLRSERKDASCVQLAASRQINLGFVAIIVCVSECRCDLYGGGV